MNIDEYRAQVQIEQEAEQGAQTEQTATIDVEQGVQETVQTDTTPTEIVTEEPAQIEPVTDTQVQELQAQLAQAQQHLTQAQEAKVWFDKINENPEYAKAFAEDKGLTYVNPESRAVQELERKYNAMLVEKEIQVLETKYPDFNPQQVVQVAVEKGLKNLEDAYHLSKLNAQPTTQTLDVEALKAQIRQEVLNEVQSQVSTTSMIGGGSGSTTVQPTGIELTAQELKVAQAFGISPAEYQNMKAIN